MTDNLPKTFQMRFDLTNQHDLEIAQFLRQYPWSRTQKVKEILLMYIQGELVHRNSDSAEQGKEDTAAKV
ncbi:MAG: hypothetical protein JW908_09095 [Anaerolineales bacterium]|nr:hypothetical protein [Anaerolineales bacterium]